MKKAHPEPFAAMKYILVLLFAGFLLSGLMRGRVSHASFESVNAAVLAAADNAPRSEGDNQMLRRLYGLDPESLEAVTLYYPTSSMAADELLLVKFADPDQGETIRQAMQSRIDSQHSSFDGYAPEQAAMLENSSVVEVRGNYALLVVGADAAAVLSAFSDAL